MATQPVSWHEKRPSNVEQVNELWRWSEVGSSRGSPSLDKMAPTAEPEDDIDMLESGIKEENESAHPASSLEADQTNENYKSVNVRGRDSSPPSSPISTSSSEESPAKEEASSPEVEAAEWSGDVDIISDATGSSSSQEWTEGLRICGFGSGEKDPACKDVEMAGGETITEENSKTLRAAVDGDDPGSYGPDHFQPAVDEPDGIGSPPFADEEGEEVEEEEMNEAIPSCHQQFKYSANVLNSSDLPPVPLGALSNVRQEELHSQIRHGPAPRGGNQEAAQQVLSHSDAPLSTVATEMTNQGEATSQSPGRVAAVRKRSSGAVVRTDEERRTGGEKEPEGEANEVVWCEHAEGQSGITETIQVQEDTGGSWVVPCRYTTHVRMKSSWCGDSQSDSGVSADLSPCSSSVSGTASPGGSQAALSQETPIEKEIRRAVEREQSLRRSRGLPDPSASVEYVDIPLWKPFLSYSPPAKSKWCQGKARELAGKKMQQEINEETQREQDLVQLGKVPGSYDKGSLRQVKERKELFETLQKPADSNLETSIRSSDKILTVVNQEDALLQLSAEGGSRRTQRLEVLDPTGSLNTATRGGPTAANTRGMSYPKGTNHQVDVDAEEANFINAGAPRALPSQSGRCGRTLDWEQVKADEETLSKENPFFKLRPSANVLKVEQDIRETQEREAELRKQRITLYGATDPGQGGCGGGRRVSMDEKKTKLSPDSSNGPFVTDLPNSSCRRGSSGAVMPVRKWPPTQTKDRKISL